MSHDLFGTSLLIVQAPMAGVQDAALAIAAGRAGALGSLPAAMYDGPALRAQLTALRDAALPAYNVNFFCHAEPAPDAEREKAWLERLTPYYAELGVEPPRPPYAPGRIPFGPDSAALVEEFRPPVVSFHFGLPSEELLARVRATGARILSSATTADEARWLEARGVDGIVAQGIEAGGHRGMFLSDDLSAQPGTIELVRAIAHAVRVPVIAAGGIADRAGVIAALAAGAAAAQVGTAYLLCPEATTSAVHRAALASAAARATDVTNVFTGRPARGIVNRLMRELGPMSPDVPAFPRATAALTPLRAKAESHGSGDFSPLWAGTDTSGCRPASAGEITRALAGL